MKETKKILLTGATGFVGHNFYTQYKDQFEIITLNLRTIDLNDFSFKSIDCVIHCAALVHQMNGAPEIKYFKVNTELTKKLADRAKSCGVKHFIFISTAHVYGSSGDLKDHQSRLTENSPCHPQDAYGKSKFAAEQYLRTIETSDFVVSIIRPPLVYGKNAKGNIIALSKLIKTLPFLPFNFTSNQRSIIYVGNLCQFIALTVQKRVSGVLLPQDSKPLSLAELTSLIAIAMNRKVWLFKVPTCCFGIIFKVAPRISRRLYGSLAFDNTISQNKLDYKPGTDTIIGLQSMLKKIK